MSCPCYPLLVSLCKTVCDTTVAPGSPRARPEQPLAGTGRAPAAGAEPSVLVCKLAWVWKHSNTPSTQVGTRGYSALISKWFHKVSFHRLVSKINCYDSLILTIEPRWTYHSCSWHSMLAFLWPFTLKSITANMLTPCFAPCGCSLIFIVHESPIRAVCSHGNRLYFCFNELILITFTATLLNVWFMALTTRYRTQWNQRCIFLSLWGCLGTLSETLS